MSEDQLISHLFDYDGGRQITVYLPEQDPRSLVYAADGQRVAGWGRSMESSGIEAVMIVGVHSLDDEKGRLAEYSPVFDPRRFSAHEEFLVEEVRNWVTQRLGEHPPPTRTAIYGASAGAELALAMGIRHPEIFGTVLACSPGAGYRPPSPIPAPVPRTFLLAGTDEPFFLDNAHRWAEALAGAAGQVEMRQEPGSHGDAMWQGQFPEMLRWAFSA